jgi:hypothetical protein
MLYTARNSANIEMIAKKPVHACVARLPPNARLAIMRVPGGLQLATKAFLRIAMIYRLPTCNAHKGETNDEVAINSVEEYNFMSNCRNELEKDEKPSW